jgi:translation initiation factor 3 subunit C
VEITAVRGKKGTDRREQIDLLVELESVANAHNLGPAVQVRIGFAIVAAILDYSLKVHEVQKVQFWLKLIDKVNELLTIAISSKDILTIDENVAEDAEELERSPYKVRGCLMTVFERTDEEFLKVLKELDSHSFEYVERVQDEKKMCEMLERLIGYLESTHLKEDKGIMCRAYYKKIEHIYYKFDTRVLKKSRGEYKGETSVDDIQKLCSYIYTKDTTDRLRTRAMLCHIYHHALHDNWFLARDLILMSHLQEVIQHSDPPTQIMYNRAMVQLGVCAFRHENIQEAHNALSDLMMSGRVKELLAQGLMPQHRHDRSPEQEKIERSRQVPFHMQLNLDVIECVYLCSAMLIEVPYIAEHEFDAKRRPISKTFYHQLRTLEKQSLTGPAESMREHVVAAARAMKKGDWEKCYTSLVNEKMDRKVWHYFSIYEYTVNDVKYGVKDMLKRKIKEECLRTYLFTYSNVYDSISLPRLADMYSMEYKHVHSVVAKMIINQELMASMDEPSKTIVLHRTEPSRLQSMLLQLSDKINILRETSDRNFESNKIQGGPGTMGPGGKGRQFNRQDWKNRRNQNQNRGDRDGQQRGGDRRDRGDRGGDRGDRGGGRRDRDQDQDQK